MKSVYDNPVALAALNRALQKIRGMPEEDPCPGCAGVGQMVLCQSTARGSMLAWYACQCGAKWSTTRLPPETKSHE